ncbi:uncharacterized protein LOC133815604 [Humulus lupulus]|uniref:uncharacterized protein LOC133815604 n=1 Tax=Humulus lupulus TaxID=3486 RepID=UPI002B410210|nr:uncharacterized protein LOC133815604 [Humulus lupulus]
MKMRMEVGESHLLVMDRIMAWNVQGLNNPNKQNEIKYLISNKKIGLVGLLETRVKTQKLGEVYIRMFARWCFSSNNAWHKGGRIIISWNPAMFQVDIRKCSSQMIHLEVKTGDRHEGFLITFVYAFNDANGRNLLWRDLKGLASRIRQPWVVLGDFNDILNTEERVGIRSQGIGTLAFKECIEECKLEDVKYLGCFFTWNNKQDKNSRIYSKLDRVMANQEWFIKYELTEVMFLPEGNLDHSPAVLTVYPEVRGGKQPFKYFRMWQLASDYKQKVQGSWDQPCQGTAMFKLLQKLKRLKIVLRDINKKGFDNISVADTLALQKLLRKQQSLQEDPLNEQLIKQEELARQKYLHIHKSYISFLHQK